MILRHNDKKTYFLMTYHPSLTDLVFLPQLTSYYRLMFPCYFVFKNMSLKEYVFLSLCLQNILSFLCLKEYVIKRICLFVIVSTKHIIVFFAFKNMSLKNMSFCHCVYKIYYRFFAFKNMSLKEYVFLSLCLQNILLFLCL